VSTLTPGLRSTVWAEFPIDEKLRQARIY
jgi:hypothetical protein